MEKACFITLILITILLGVLFFKDVKNMESPIVNGKPENWYAATEEQRQTEIERQLNVKEERYNRLGL